MRMEDQQPPTEEGVETDRQMLDGWLPKLPINVQRLLVKFRKARYLIARKISVLGQLFKLLPPNVNEIPLDDAAPMVAAEVAEPQDVHIPLEESDFYAIDPLPSDLDE